MFTLEILLVVFVILKLCGAIYWPWMLVLLPLWILIGTVLLIMAAESW